MMAPMQDPRFRGDDEKIGGGDDKNRVAGMTKIGWRG